jgi:two-component system, OmpR family, sensor histidine kinase KdpD
MARDILHPVRSAGPVRAVASAVVLPAAATLVGRAFLPSGETAASLYILAVVGAAALGGLWSGLGAAVLSFLGLNYFFTAPRDTFRVDKEEDLVALVVFLIVAALVATLLARALEARARAARREREARVLQFFATKLLAPEPLEQRLQDLAAALVETLDLVRCRIDARVEPPLSLEAAAPGAEGEATAVPILAGTDQLGTLSVLRREEVGPLAPTDEGLLRSCAGQIAVALERARLDAAVEHARLTSETSQIRAALFSSVTHDLRTPLASIKASVTSLLDEGVHDRAQERELLQTVLEETDRLNRLVGNIVDLARVRSGALVPAKELGSVEEVLESVLHRLGARLSRVSVRTLMRPNLPDVMMDPVQIDQVLTNLLENAVAFSPPAGHVQVVAAPWRDGVRITVSDQGPGVPAEERERVFEAFYRGASSSGRSGSGLGLAIARAIVLAHGGRIRIEGSPSGGAAVVVELPADAAPIAQEPVP